MIRNAGTGVSGNRSLRQPPASCNRGAPLSPPPPGFLYFTPQWTAALAALVMGAAAAAPPDRCAYLDQTPLPPWEKRPPRRIWGVSPNRLSRRTKVRQTSPPKLLEKERIQGPRRNLGRPMSTARFRGHQLGPASPGGWAILARSTRLPGPFRRQAGRRRKKDPPGRRLLPGATAWRPQPPWARAAPIRSGGWRRIAPAIRSEAAGHHQGLRHACRGGS